MNITKTDVSARFFLLLAGLLLAGWLAPAPPAAAQLVEGLEPPKPAAPETAEEAAARTADLPPGVAYRERIVHQGIAIDFEIKKIKTDADHILREGDDVAFRFEITDTAGGNPLSSVYPGAWMDLKPETERFSPKACKEKVEAFVGGSLFSPPELDLNVYYVLALNNDATISVVDPLFGFGTTKLLNMIFLDAPGEDWALTDEQRTLFVSLPDVDEIAVADTNTWKVTKTVEVGPRPTRVALQPDGRYLWVAHDPSEDAETAPANEASQITVIDTEKLEVAAELAVGRGPHELAFSDDNRFAFITNRREGTLSIFDVRRLEKVADVAVGEEPVSVAFSTIGGDAWVVNRKSGTLAVVDPDRREVVNRIQAEPGLGQLRFAPDGRLGMVVNPEQDLVHVIDVSVNRIVQTGEIDYAPDQVTFSDELAYVRPRDNESIIMIPLDGLGIEGARLPVVDFPGGQRPYSKAAMPSPADSIVQAPGATAVLVANPADKSIYFYKEGMAAPMGHFQNYEREPRAVLALDRSLREHAPGVYETTATLRSPGHYDVAFFLDAPRTIHCFEVDVARNPELEEKEGRARKVDVAFLMEKTVVPVGKPVQVKFRLTDAVTGEPRSDLEGVEMMTFRAPGRERVKHPAVPLGDGVYGAELTPDHTGVWYVFIGVESLGVPFNVLPSLVLHAQDGAAQPVGKTGQKEPAEGGPAGQGAAGEPGM